MCVVNSDKSKYQIILSTLDDDPICSINFISISSAARFLEEVNFDHVKCALIRLSDLLIFDVDLVLELWKGGSYVQD